MKMGHISKVYTLQVFGIYNVEVTLKKTANQLYIYSAVLGAAIKCKRSSEITVESGTHVKRVKITLNIFAVYLALQIHTTEVALEYTIFKLIPPNILTYHTIAYPTQ